MFSRNALNPLISPEMISPPAGYKVLGTFNAGAELLGDDLHLLVRVALAPENSTPGYLVGTVFDHENKRLEQKVYAADAVDSFEERVFYVNGQIYLTSISVFYHATIDSEGNINVDADPAIVPSDKLNEFGVEDPRICKIEDTFYITYCSVSRHGQSVRLLTTKDFQTYEDCGTILAPNNKDVIIFPQKINAKYYMLHRPSAEGTPCPEMWSARSDDLLHWGEHKHFMSPEYSWGDGRIGAGTQVILTRYGWVEFYHGATKDNVYSVGLVLLDKDDPEKILWSSEKAIAVPEESYETDGFFSSVIFPTAAFIKNERVHLIYGAADTYVCEMSCSLRDLEDYIEEHLSK